MADRRGPSSGYDHGPKRQYRREVWATLASECPVPRAEAHAFLMPSLEGDEIDVALSKGFREHNLHICDENPAIVATLKRRYPRLNTYGVDVVRALRRCPPLHVVNLDLCGTVWSARPRVNAAVRRLSARTGGVLAITYLRGRDSIREGDKTYDREAVVWDAATQAGRTRRQWVRLVRGEQHYQISASPMAWNVLHVSAAPVFEAIRTLQSRALRDRRPMPSVTRIVSLPSFPELVDELGRDDRDLCADEIAQFHERRRRIASLEAERAEVVARLAELRAMETGV